MPTAEGRCPARNASLLISFEKYILSMKKDYDMPSHETLFTPTEAAALTRLPLKAVNNAIDKKTISAFAGMVAGRPTRLLDDRALVSLSLERRLGDCIAPELRRKIFDALAESPRNIISLEGGLLKIDLREARRELATSLRELRRVRRLVVSDPEIMGGNPVFRGTRVPVHAIAQLVDQDVPEAELLAGYPRLTPEMVRLAPLYAAAYPLRGRPRRQPWHDRRPAHQSRRRLAAIAITTA
jgi:uncharacterized protein (DUF433 family)